MTKQELTRLNINYDPESGVVFHWSKHRGWVALKRHVQNVKDNAYYIFREGNKIIALREETIIKAFKEE